jgi:site-specific DNA recombinase
MPRTASLLTTYAVTLDKKGSHSCPSKYLYADKFESAVVQHIRDHILPRDNLSDLVRMVNEETDLAMRSSHIELEVIDDSLSDINRRMDRMYDLIETGKLQTSDVVVRIHDLRLRQEQLQARRVEIENQISDRKVELADLSTICAFTDDLVDLLRGSSLVERRAFIKSFIKEVKVTGDEVVLTYTPPFVLEKVALQIDKVLHIVQYGGRDWARTHNLRLYVSI